MSSQATTTRFLITLGLVMGGAVLPVATAAQTAVTVYSSPHGAIPDLTQGQGRQMPASGFAVIHQTRQVTVPNKTGEIRLQDVAARIDPTTVMFEIIKGPHTRVLEQDFQFDLVNSQKLLEKYIDQTIQVEQVMGQSTRSIEGKLLSTDGGLVIQNQQGEIEILRSFHNVRFPQLPGGLITRPSLVWKVQSERSGPRTAKLSYQAEGLSWWADYNLTYRDRDKEGQCEVDVAAWVTLLNQSGGSYNDARLKLVAGDVQRLQDMTPSGRREVYAAMAKVDENRGFEQKAFFEYHLYTLGRQVDLPDKSTKQLELFPTAQQVPCEKTLVYYGLPAQYRGVFAQPILDRHLAQNQQPKVDVYLKFENKKNKGLGKPLPAGRVRVNKRDSDGSLEFIGEDRIDHTPKDESVLIRMGSAFDVVGERKQTDFKLNRDQHWLEEEIEVQLRNHKDSPVTVQVKENLYRWVNWKITESSQDWKQEDSRTVFFPIKLAPGETKVVRYRVRYSW